MRGKGRFTQKIVGSRTLRTAFSVLFILNTVVLICASQGLWFLGKNAFYYSDGEVLRSEVTDQLMERRSHDALLYEQCRLRYIKTRDPATAKQLSEYEESFREDNSNFFFFFRKNGVIVSNNYTRESGYSYYPKPAEFFASGENADLLEDWKSMTFEGHLKKTLTAHDAFWKADRFFYYANVLKYAVLALAAASALFECVFAYVLFVAAERRAVVRERDLDQIPLYLLLPFGAMLGVFCVLLLRRQNVLLFNLVEVFSGADLQQALIICLLVLFMLAAALQSLVKTISVRLHRPMWWRRSILYRTFAARSFSQRARTVLSILFVLQFAAYLVVFLVNKDDFPFWVFPVADGVFVLTMMVLLYVVWKDMSVFIPHTHRIAAERRGYVPTDGLSESGRRHAENINFLSRSASAETEKRFVNESFSTQLIHSVSHGLRRPLRDVAENVRMLEQDDLTETQARQCTGRILSLSQELKKTIEDMILISKATTGNLPFEPVPTDAGMMLSQAVGEFDALFAEKGVDAVTEQPDEPVLIRADGQYMWYIFEGILSVMLENAVAGTRLFLRARRAGEKAVIVFRCTVRPQAAQQLHGPAGMGMSSAKVFTMLQDGVMADRLSHDTLTAVLQFPAVMP